MPKKAEITEAQWLNEIVKLSKKKDDDGWTMRELVASCGRDPRWVADRVRDALAAGKAFLGKKSFTRINGTTAMVPCYRFKAKEAK